MPDLAVRPTPAGCLRWSSVQPLSTARLAREDARATSPTNARDLKHDKIKIHTKTCKVNKTIDKNNHFEEAFENLNGFHYAAD